MHKLIGLDKIIEEISNLQEIPNVLLIGARGTGKTTLAKEIVKIKQLKSYFLIGASIKKIELIKLLMNIENKTAIIIDEIHGLSRDAEEILYNPMEYKKLSIKGVNGEVFSIDLPDICIIGTTTKPNLISKPLLSRFQLIINIPHYNLRQLARIIKLNYPEFTIRECIKIAINITTPREAVNLAYRIYQLKNKMSVEEALKFIGYKCGLSYPEQRYIKILKEFNRLSQTSLCSALQVDIDELKYIEDSLLKKKMITITNKGRELSVRGLLKTKEL